MSWNLWYKINVYWSVCVRVLFPFFWKNYQRALVEKLKKGTTSRESTIGPRVSPLFFHWKTWGRATRAQICKEKPNRSLLVDLTAEGVIELNLHERTALPPHKHL